MDISGRGSCFTLSPLSREQEVSVSGIMTLSFLFQDQFTRNGVGYAHAEGPLKEKSGCESLWQKELCIETSVLVH